LIERPGRAQCSRTLPAAAPQGPAGVQRSGATWEVEVDPSRPESDVDYLRGGRGPPASGSLLRSTSKYLNSPVIRDLYCNEGLRRASPDVLNTALIPDFYEAFDAVVDQAQVARLFREDAARRPDLAAWLEARHLANLSYDQVRDCPPGTLGHGVKGLMDRGFKLYFSHLGPAESDFSYLRKRRSQVHDIEHIVTGFPGVSLPGEIALYLAHMTASARYFHPVLAKETSLISSFLFTTWTLRTALHYPEAMLAICDAMEKGVALGKAVRRPLFMERWEDYLDWPLPELRARFGIPEPEGFVGDWGWREPQEPLAAE
jgi:ubiquinone biosynthesis protein Coq4